MKQSRLFAIALGMLTFLFLSAISPWAGEKKDKDDPQGVAEDNKKDDPFKGLKYRFIGPAAGGRVSRAAGIAGDPSTYYLGAASGGVWKTSDGGLTWKPIFDDQPTSSIGAIAVAPSDPNVIYVGSGEANIRGNVAPGNGIYLSTNAGKSWKHVWKQDKVQIGHIVIHPKNADIAFAAVLGSAFGPSPERGIYRTIDGGKTWKQVLKKDADTGAIDVTFDPNNPRILFAALWQARRTPWNFSSGGPGSGLYRSDDGGDSWKLIGPKTKNDDEEDNGLPESIWGRVGIAVAPSDSRRVYALIEAENGGLFRSDDGGDKWELVNKARYLRTRPWYFSTVHVDPANPDIVYCPNVRLLKSGDGGKTFKNLKGPHHPDHHDLWIDPKNPKRMIDSNDGGVDITTNGGETWHAPQLPLCQFYHINVDNSVPYRVMGTMQDQGTASGPSNSLASGGISLSDWHTVGGGETGFAVPDPSDPNIVYAGEYAGYISRYDHRTRQARNISAYPISPSGKGGEELKYRFQWTAPIMISPHDPKTIYHAANVLFRTRDAGKTWDAISPDLTTDDKSKQKPSGGPITGDNTGAEMYCTIFALAESPRKEGVLWAGSDDGLVHVSRDGGKAWTKVTPRGFPPFGTVCCIEASPHDPAAAYLVVDAHRLDDNKPYLFKTTDYGETWKSLATQLPRGEYLRVIREDPKTPGLIFAGSEHRVSFSRDGGANWHDLKLNMPTAGISDLQVKDHDLVVGTNGRSIWILDDIEPLRKWAGKPAGLAFYPAPATVRWRYHGENYAGDDRIPGDNPSKGALLTYYLDKKPREEVTLEILDGAGQLVRKLSSKKVEPESEEDAPDVPWSIFKPTTLPKEPGFNRVAWDLTYSGPTVIPGAKNDFGVPHRGPLVTPGKYTLKLTVDGVTRTQSVEVMMDPRVKLPPAELEKSLRFALQLRKEISAVAETVIQLQAVRRQLRDRVREWNDFVSTKKLVAQAQTLIGKLDALEDKFHNPKAEVAYDILAMKGGGAKLYSQLTGLYEWVKDSDGPITQGMLKTAEAHQKELTTLLDEWRRLLGELDAWNDHARAAQVPSVTPGGSK